MWVPSCQTGRRCLVFSAIPSAIWRLSHRDANSCSVGSWTWRRPRWRPGPARISAWTLRELEFGADAAPSLGLGSEADGVARPVDAQAQREGRQTVAARVGADLARGRATPTRQCSASSRLIGWSSPGLEPAERDKVARRRLIPSSRRVALGEAILARRMSSRFSTSRGSNLSRGRAAAAEAHGAEPVGVLVDPLSRDAESRGNLGGRNELRLRQSPGLAEAAASQAAPCFW